jgi:oligoribonuclease
MAGNSVHFDRKFLEAQMPEVLDYVNYRLLDVSTLKVLCMATIPGAKTWEAARGDPAHTPLKDLEASLSELAHWRKELSRS